MDESETPLPTARPRVAVVFGGRSSEHAISCVTAGSVLRAVDRDRYDVVPGGSARDGRWVLVPDDPDRLAIADGHLPSVDGGGASVVLAADPTLRELVVTDPGQVPRALGQVDVVLPLLHGPYGEDGTIQGLLELAGVRYVGSGVLSSAVAMDKHYMKVVLAGHGLPVGRHVVVRPQEWTQDPAAVRESVAAIGWPVFVKPARGGSSIGISKVDGPAELDAAIEAARRHDPKVVVEAAVPGREIEVGVVEDEAGGAPLASVPGEIRVVSGHAFYDFEAKYLEEGTVALDVPADVPEDVAARAGELAVAAFRALGCEGLARVDLFLLPTGELVVNEVNTMPGFTPTSMFPRLWAASGLDYPALLDRLLGAALNRPTGLR
ncbi:MAG TPA: D-alanine--D-alanine ligase family protein [Jiangellales bacterium]|nr:D-alanine--D-alanine ligase family protein [Jiangellales bacterium]